MPDELNTSPPAREVLDQDTKDLHEMGYAQELKRSMSRFSNFDISFTIISILSGCLTLYGYGLNHGGPPTMLWGWLLVGVIVIFVAMSMGEICSSFPTAGGLYYWAAKLPPRRPLRSGPGSPGGSTSSARSRSRRASASAAHSPFLPS